MKAVKVGDIGTEHDGYPETKVTEGSPDVFIDGKPAARVGDPLEPHDKPGAPEHGRVIISGSSSVFINGRPAALTNGEISCGGVTIGSGTVNIGSNPHPGKEGDGTRATKAPSASSIPKEISVPIKDNTEAVPEELEAAAKKEKASQFNITDIPTAMRDVMKWPKSAELMELWFSLPAREMTDDEKRGIIKPKDFPQGYINTTMFTWDWLDQFKQVTEAQEELLNSLFTTNSKNTLTGYVANQLKSNILKERIISISNKLDPVQLHSDWQFQRAPVGYTLGSVDDLYGSLGNFGLYAAVTKATVTKMTDHYLTPNRYSVHLTEVGLYMKDTYDFIGEQYLGHWSPEGLTIEPTAGALNEAGMEYKLPCWSFKSGGMVEAFGNADYRTFRDKTSQGGNLLLFSDVKTVPVDITFDVVE